MNERTPANTPAVERAQTDAAFATATNATMNRAHWAHHVAINAIHNGVNADWLTENFASRMVIWFNAGETVAGAVEMLVFSWRESAPARRADREADGLRSMLLGARVGGAR